MTHRFQEELEGVSTMQCRRRRMKVGAIYLERVLGESDSRWRDEAKFRRTRIALGVARACIVHRAGRALVLHIEPARAARVSPLRAAIADAAERPRKRLMRTTWRLEVLPRVLQQRPMTGERHMTDIGALTESGASS